MNELEFLPAWYARMLRRRRLAFIGAVAALIIVTVVFAFKW